MRIGYHYICMYVCIHICIYVYTVGLLIKLANFRWKLFGKNWHLIVWLLYVWMYIISACLFFTVEKYIKPSLHLFVFSVFSKFSKINKYYLWNPLSLTTVPLQQKRKKNNLLFFEIYGLKVLLAHKYRKSCVGEKVHHLLPGWIPRTSVLGT